MPQDEIRGREGGHIGSRATLRRAALGAALVALIVCANTAAARAGDDDSSGNESFYDRFMRSIGLKDWGVMQYGINYSERSPLVVPPTRDLPPPAADAPRTPDWPKDPDIRRRAEAKAKEKVVPHGDNFLDDSRPLRPDELNVPGANTARSDGNAEQTTPARPPKKSIFSFDFLKKEEYATFTGEPERTSLTDPPPGYLTPSPDQPYGISPEKKQYKVQTVGDHAVGVMGQGDNK